MAQAFTTFLGAVGMGVLVDFFAAGSKKGYCGENTDSEGKINCESRLLSN
jgi:hypothetical protein